MNSLYLCLNSEYLYKNQEYYFTVKETAKNKRSKERYDEERVSEN